MSLNESLILDTHVWIWWVNRDCNMRLAVDGGIR